MTSRNYTDVAVVLEVEECVLMELSSLDGFRQVCKLSWHFHEICILMVLRGRKC